MACRGTDKWLENVCEPLPSDGKCGTQLVAYDQVYRSHCHMTHYQLYVLKLSAAFGSWKIDVLLGHVSHLPSKGIAAVLWLHRKPPPPCQYLLPLPRSKSYAGFCADYTCQTVLWFQECFILLKYVSPHPTNFHTASQFRKFLSLVFHSQFQCILQFICSQKLDMWQYPVLLESDRTWTTEFLFLSTFLLLEH